LFWLQNTRTTKYLIDTDIDVGRACGITPNFGVGFNLQFVNIFVNIARRGILREGKTERKTDQTDYLDMTINNAIRKRRNPPQKR
jgi:hypothetical protein